MVALPGHKVANPANHDSISPFHPSTEETPAAKCGDRQDVSLFALCQGLTAPAFPEMILIMITEPSLSSGPCLIVCIAR